MSSTLEASSALVLPATPSIDTPRRQRVALFVARAAVVLALWGTAFSPPVTNVGVGVALLAFLFVPDAMARLRAVLRLPVARAALLLLGTLAVAMLWADAPWSHRLHTLWGWRPLLWMVWVMALFSSARSVPWVQGMQRVQWVQWAVTLSVVAGVGAALWSFVGWGVALKLIESMPFGTVLRNPSTQSMVFVAALTLALVLATLKSKFRWVWVTAALVLAANLLFVTTGRSGQMAAALVALTLTLTLTQGRVRRGLLWALPVVAAAVIAFSPVVQQRFGLGWHEMHSVQESTGNNSMGMRVVMWRNTVEVIRASPWWGHGMGGFDAAYVQQLDRHDTSWRATPTTDPHNQFLFVWASAGLPGLAAFVWFLVAVARQSAPRPWKQAALALVLAWSMSSLFSSHFQTFAEGHLIALLLGLLLAPQGDQSAAKQSAVKTADSTAA